MRCTRKLQHIFFLMAFVAIALGQNDDSTMVIPECVSICYQAVLSADGCASSALHCHCAHEDAIKPAMVSCIAKEAACSAQNPAVFTNAVSSYCEQIATLPPDVTTAKVSWSLTSSGSTNAQQTSRVASNAAESSSGSIATPSRVGSVFETGVFTTAASDTVISSAVPATSAAVETTVPDVASPPIITMSSTIFGSATTVMNTSLPHQIGSVSIVSGTTGILSGGVTQTEFNASTFYPPTPSTPIASGGGSNLSPWSLGFVNFLAAFAFAI